MTAGWLDRHESPQDRRHLNLTLTAEGSDVLAAVMTHRRRTFTTILEQMTPQDRAAVRASFDTFSDAAADVPSSLDRQ